MRPSVTFARLPGCNGRYTPAAIDAILAATLCVGVALGSVAAATVQVPPRPLDVGGYLLVAVAAGGLAWRRIAPLATLVGAVTAVSTYLLVGYPYGPIQLCMVLAMFAVARQCSLPTSLLACGLAVVAAVTAVLPRLAHGATQPVILVVAWMGWLVVPWTLGALVYVRAEAVTRLRRDLIARVALEERIWIAREVHDVAGHGFSAIAMQAGVALLILDERPDQVRVSLAAIHATSTHALDELRAVLGTFHSPESTSPVALTTNYCGWHDLRALVDRVGAAGLPVDLEMPETDIALPRGIAAVAYRVVQEALTNVLRHAGPTHALVQITREDGNVVVTIADRGHGHGGGGQGVGRGLTGMRSRVEAIGGSFAAGPRDGGGFRVVASLPLPEAIP